MEMFKVGRHVKVFLAPEDPNFSLQLFVQLGPESARVFLTQQEAAYLAGILVHCVLQRVGPPAALKAFRGLTMAEVLDSSAFPGKAMAAAAANQEGPEEPEGPILPPFPPGV